jgi:hypothetical protein
MDEIYVYFVPLPDGVYEMVVPCCDGYTVYIDERLDETERVKKYKHALDHIQNRDHEKSDVQSIEARAHM